MAAKIRRNLIAAVTSYGESLARLAERLEDLKQYDHTAGCTADLEVRIRIRLERLQNHRSLISLDQLETDRYTGCGELVAMKTSIENAKAKVAALSADTDELERLLLSYELPKRGSCELLEPYLIQLRDFMSEAWRMPARSKRRMGHKCLLEWVAELDRPPPDQRRFEGATSAQLKGTLINLGAHLSVLLVNYMWMVTAQEEAREVEERLEEIGSVIGFLSIEAGSPVIGRFLNVVEFFAGTVGARVREGPNMERAPWGENEAEVFRMILVEILRLEVAFRSPDLPTRVKNTTYVYMAWHLKNAVFMDNLNNIRNKICDFDRRKRPPESFDGHITAIMNLWLGIFNATSEADEHGNIRIDFK